MLTLLKNSFVFCTYSLYCIFYLGVISQAINARHVNSRLKKRESMIKLHISV